MIVLVAFAFHACKDKPTQKVQKPKTTVVKKTVKKDTAAIDSLKKVAEAKKVVKKVEAPKPPNKYFLIAGSFQSRRNADIFKARLEKEGYTSSVIERRTGPNTDFYKVSYKGFHDRKLAYAELRKARNSEGRDNVWLLVKK
ncbi:SPOR domain-containing protein [Marinilabiliaceae bacterium N1Y90]|nr:SPOR domain-containing protein [Marinilabiliaceae bacterium N1Y90]